MTRQIPATSRQETPAPKSALDLRSTPAHIRLQYGAIALNTDGILHGILNTPPTLKLQTTPNTHSVCVQFLFDKPGVVSELARLDDPGSESRQRKPLMYTCVILGVKRPRSDNDHLPHLSPGFRRNAATPALPDNPSSGTKPAASNSTALRSVVLSPR